MPSLPPPDRGAPLLLWGALGLAALLAAAGPNRAAPARAQGAARAEATAPQPVRRGPPPPDEAGDRRRVAAALGRLGLVDLSGLNRRGPNFAGEARTATGVAARVVVNGASGAILGLRFMPGGGPKRQ